MWIITDFSLCTGMTRALPGKRPLLVPAGLRNPQHFHRLCTGLAPLRTSHPHVCAQAAGKRSCVGWQAAADLHRRRYSYAGQRAACENPRHAGPIAPLPGRDRRPPPPGLTSSRRWKPSLGPGRALVGTGMIKSLANRKPLPAADGCRILCNLSVVAGIVTRTVDICAMRANS